MTPEVKERIDQIRHGIVPEGYKKGKLGIVPVEWDEVSFSTLFTTTSDYTDDLERYPLYSLTIEDGITAKTERYERRHLVKKGNSYKIIQPDDYAYNPMNIRFGAVARHKGSKPVAVSGYYDIFTTVYECDHAFMDSFLTCGPMITYYNKVSKGSLIEKQRVHFSDFLAFSLPLPPLGERIKIAEILSVQDKVIELEQQKIEEIIKKKQFFLEKMFPKEGKAVPEIRFKGFADPWEQRKLGELVEFYNGDRSSRYPNDTDMVSEGIPFINAGDLVSGRVKLDTANKITEEKYNELSGAKIQRGDIIYCLRGTLGKNAFVDNFDIGTVASSLVDIRPRKIVGKYLFQVLNSGIEYRQRTLNDEGAAQPNLSAKNLSLFDVPIPDEAEQTRIAEYFENLDRLITLHQRKLEEEKKKKKALMQLLLTGIVRV